MASLNQIRSKEVEKLAKPLIEWIQKNGSPHSIITIEQGIVKFYTGEFSIPFEIKD
jgi:hypothetical protein